MHPTDDLVEVVERTHPGDLLLLEDGIYKPGTLIHVYHDLTIRAANPGRVVIDGQNQHGLFKVTNPPSPPGSYSAIDTTAVFHGLNLTGAKTGRHVRGAAITAQGTGSVQHGKVIVEAVDCSIYGNDAGSDSGTQTAGGAFWATGGPGKALFERCKIFNNQAWMGGAIGGVFDDIAVKDCLVRDNVATGNDGGAFYVMNDFLISGSTVTGNRAGAKGGALHVNANSQRQISIYDSTFANKQPDEVNYNAGTMCTLGTTGLNSFSYTRSQVSGYLPGQCVAPPPAPPMQPPDVISGCGDKSATNYDPSVAIHRPLDCKYGPVGPGRVLIDGENSRIHFGPNNECTLTLKGTKLESTCEIDYVKAPE